MTARSTSTDSVITVHGASTGPVVARLAVLIRFGFVEFRAANPPTIFLTAMLPRDVLQAVFWTVLGGIAGGANGSRYAYIGAVVISLTGVLGSMTDAPTTDKWVGTYTRLLRGRSSTAAIYLCRGVAPTLVGILEMLACWLVVAALTGHLDTAVDMLPALPVTLLIALTMAAAGVACAAFCVGRRAEVALYNLAIYLIIVASNALIPRGKLPVLDAIGTVLPGTHGLTVVRAIADHQAWSAGALLAEAAVGVGWLLVGVALHRYLAGKARRTGSDTFS